MEQNLDFDLEFRYTFSIEEFVEKLALHLGKTQEERTRGEKIKTIFLSMSPQLEWTLHATGQRSKGGHATGLAIFDVERLRRTSDATIFRVVDIINFLKAQGKSQLIAPNLQDWARNCDEYVYMGKSLDHGLVRWIEWAELSALPILLDHENFVKAFTVRLYREWKRTEYVERAEVEQKVMESVITLAGTSNALAPLVVDSLMRPGLDFWGFEVSFAESEMIRAEIRAHIDALTLEQLAGLSLAD